MTSELALLYDTALGMLGGLPETETDDGWSPTAWRRLGETGLTGLGIPEALGGSGGGLREACVVLHAVGASAAPVPLAEATVLGGRLLEVGGLAVPASGGVLSFACGGSAVRAGDGWVLTGSAERVPWARDADWLAVLADCDADALILLVPAADYETAQATNLAGEHRDTVRFTGSEVPDDRTAGASPLLGEELRARGAVSRVVMTAGAAESVLTMTSRYVQERSQFGRPIAKFQAVQQSLARMAAETAVLGAAAQVCVQAICDSANDWQAIAAAKTRTGRAATATAAIAHQLHGALGVTWEHQLRRYTTRLWAWRDEFGNESEWARHLGAWVIKSGSSTARSAVAGERPEEC